jgi:hypothetical protein
VKASQFVQQFEDVWGFQQRMVVIGQHTPRDGSGGVPLKKAQQISREAIHALGRVSDVSRVFVTGG